MGASKVLGRAAVRWAPLIMVSACVSGPCLMVPLAVSAEVPCWPRFHGPNGDNHSADTGLLKKWPVGGPKLLWTAKGIGHGFAGVTISDGRIYTAGEFNNDTLQTVLHFLFETRDFEGCLVGIVNLLQVVETGKAVTSVKPGDLAVFTVRRGCGRCVPCTMNRSDMCTTGGGAGRHPVTRLASRQVSPLVLTRSVDAQ